jgi:uncharacterized membrane protein (UPF0127 family)
MRTRMTIAAVVACAALAGLLYLVFHDTNGGGASKGAFELPPTNVAAAPFAMFRATRISVGDRCLRVLVADTESRRNQGLRAVTALGHYDGMLFVNDRDTDARYTMAQTLAPLDIVFFDRNGAPVSNTSMRPCPHGTDATCPTYASSRKYRFALERPAGSSGGGALGGCAA